MLLSDEAELLAMEAEKYSGLNPVVVDNINLTIGLDSGFIDTVSSISGAISGLDNKLDISAFTGYSAGLDSALSNAFETVHNEITDLQNDDSYLSGMIESLSGGKEDKITWSYNNDGEISAANGSALAGKGYYSQYWPYGVATATSGNLLINGTRYPRQTIVSVSGENGISTAGVVPPVPEQNMTATQILVAGSGSLADVDWKEFDLGIATAINNKLDISSFNSYTATIGDDYVPYSATTITTASTAQLVDTDTVETMIISATSALDTFSGVTTDSTLTGDGKTNPLGVASVQSLTSDNTINITSGNNEVILGVNGTWFNDAVNSAYTGTTFTGVSADSTLTGNGSTSALGVNMQMINYYADITSAAAVASAQSGLIRDITFEMQNIGVFGDTMSGYNADGTVWIRNHWTVERAEASGDELNNYLKSSNNTNYISMAPSALDVFNAVRTNSASWSQGTTYSSVSGTVIVSGNDLEISQPAIRTGVPWLSNGWAHAYNGETAFNGGFQKQYNSYRLTHYMYNRQYPNSAYTGFSATMLQQDENYNVLSSTQLNGIFDFTFTPVENCEMIMLYCSGTSSDCQQGVSEYYRNGNTQKWVENLAWENETPTRNEFASLYENIAVNSGDWDSVTSKQDALTYTYVEI